MSILFAYRINKNWENACPRYAFEVQYRKQAIFVQIFAKMKNERYYFKGTLLVKPFPIVETPDVKKLHNILKI